VDLTGRQQEIWSFLVDYVDRHGYPPTVREIGEAVGLASPSTVHAHLANLERAGLLKRDPTKPRALELVGRDRAAPAVAQLPKLPLLGQIAAGGPLLAEQNVEDQIAVPETLRGDFVLRVKGDSMIDAGILDGDLVVVRRAQDAKNGDIVVALAGDDESADEATVRRSTARTGRVRLQPENAALEPIYAPHVQVLARSWGSSGSYDLDLLRAPDARARAVRPPAGASLECPLCGEFVLHDGAAVRCPSAR